MVPKSGSQLRDSAFFLSETVLATQIGEALRAELGASRRATKTVMRWTGVSDRSARAWLHGRASPSGLHLVTLAAHSDTVMTTLLKLTGRGELEIGLRLKEIEADLVRLLAIVRDAELKAD